MTQPTPVEIRIAPSDFAYLFNECPRCTADKLLKRATRPPAPFPAVFGLMDRLTSTEFAGFQTTRLGNGEWPAGQLDTAPGKMQADPIILAAYPQFSFLLSGIPDAVGYFDNGDLGILDFKVTGGSRAEEGAKYTEQLSAYAMMVEDRIGRNVTHLCLYVMKPELSVMTLNGYEHPNPTMRFTSSLIPVPVSARAVILARLTALAELLSDPAKQVSGTNCKYCQYRDAAEIQNILTVQTSQGPAVAQVIDFKTGAPVTPAELPVIPDPIDPLETAPVYVNLTDPAPIRTPNADVQTGLPAPRPPAPPLLPTTQPGVAPEPRRTAYESDHPSLNRGNRRKP
jgi:hypothetical protein